MDMTRHRLTLPALRAWYLLHKWTSLVSTLFLMVLCLTGLPLLFYEEIDHALGYSISAPARPGAHGEADLDAIVAAAAARRPGHAVRFVWFDDETPGALFVSMGEKLESDESSGSFMFDSRTGEFLHEYPLDQGVMHFVFDLHTELFAGLPGTLFVGCIGLLLTASLVSGAVLYAPFMRDRPFGSIRRDRSRRAYWLDLHNVVGVVILVWLLIVSLTGSINAVARPIIDHWQEADLSDLHERYAGVVPQRLSSPARALATARAAAPGMGPSFMSFPGTEYATPRHYIAFMQGSSAVTQRLLVPVLIDGETGALVGQRPLPWYVTLLLISQPLHFGDYGGLPLKCLWVVLDLLTLVVLGSGVRLWVRTRGVAIELPSSPTEAAVSP
jgi:uncharacterized iron-regulated membrane protein